MYTLKREIKFIAHFFILFIFLDYPFLALYFLERSNFQAQNQFLESRSQVTLPLHCSDKIVNMVTVSWFYPGLVLILTD